jgi:hypothetical protein
MSRANLNRIDLVTYFSPPATPPRALVIGFSVLELCGRCSSVQCSGLWECAGVRKYTHACVCVCVCVCVTCAKVMRERECVCVCASV